MEFTIKQISSLDKVRKTGQEEYRERNSQKALAGSSLSYQIYLNTDDQAVIGVSVASALSDHIRVYRVRDGMMDAPVIGNIPPEDYISQEPGPMPDILIPMEESQNQLYLDKVPGSLWVRVDIPADTQPGEYSVKVCLRAVKLGGEPIGDYEAAMALTVIPAVKPAQQLVYTRWIYLDCIAQAHQAEIFSEDHWAWIERYIEAAADVGINMLLVPVHTPPLDTEIGTARPCVQLVDIERVGDTYRFGFQKFSRYIALCKKYGIQYFEIAHMFSQWGAKCAPNITVTENGKKTYRFGWHVAADDPEYVAFLKQYIAAITRQLEKEGISENTYFHISDEPSLENIQAYQTAADIIRPLIGRSKTFDALSNYEFYEKGLVECPVTIASHIHEFLPHGVKDQWVYYCCGPQEVYPNAFMAMPSYRVRILGFLMYRWGIKGFLHWGFNYYNTLRSLYPIDPYVTTSGDGAFPSGDPFIVYPGQKRVYPSIRGQVTYEAVQDMDICYALEAKLGREAVVGMIDEAAGGELCFDSYPKNGDFIEDLRSQIIGKIEV